jgi:hypothetical protein
MIVYSRPLPKINNLIWVAGLLRPYPRKVSEILRVARNWHVNRNIINFLKLFPEDEQFESLDDFTNRCEEIEALIREERGAEYSYFQAPKDWL